jgi:uncharacterized delta-60 repeat protein
MKHVYLLISLLFALNVNAQPGTIDPDFNSGDAGFGNGDGPNGFINAMTVQSDGKILIGGDFTSWNGTAINRIARLDHDGKLDLTFNPGAGATGGIITAIAVQADGKILIGGNFETFNGIPVKGLVRLNADGSRDNQFDSGLGTDHGVNSIVVLDDGSILIAGNFTSYNGITARYLAKLKSNGSINTEFMTGMSADNTIHSMAVQSDGKIIIAGNFTAFNGSPGLRIARLKPDGNFDHNFQPVGASAAIKSVAVQSDGKILIGGNFTSYAGVPGSSIRLNTDGSIDTGFTPGNGTNGFINRMSVQADGKIIIVGDFTEYDGSSRKRIARLNSNGTIDAQFDPGTGADNDVLGLAMQADGKILISGYFQHFNNTSSKLIARLNANGAIDSYNTVSGVGGSISDMEIQSDGKILIGGSFFSYNGKLRNNIARINADGSIDANFDPGTGTNGPVYSLAIQADGKIIIAGEFTSYNGTPRKNIARLKADGTLDLSFDAGTGANDFIRSVDIQGDGKILIGGAFTSYDGMNAKYLTRLNTDGSLDPDFNSGAGADYYVYTIQLQDDEKILIGGGFTSYAGIARNRIARLNADGSLDAGFDPGDGANAVVWTFALQEDGKILAGGYLTSYNGVNISHIVRINSDGSFDPEFNTGAGTNLTVRDIEVENNGKILISGDFGEFDGTFRNHITRLNADGSLDAEFDPGTGANAAINAMAMQSDGNVLIGGYFTAYNETGRNRLARIFAGGSDGIISDEINTSCIVVDVSPNPANSNFNLTITGAENEEVSIEFLDVQGRIISSERLTITSGRYTKNYSADKYADGVYSVRVISLSGVSSQRVVVTAE